MINREIQAFKNYQSQFSPAEIAEQNKQRVENAKKEYAEFEVAHEKDMCYICKKSYKTISKDTPCVHWLLRECKFKKKDFEKIYEQFDFFQINAFLRWVANHESYLKNINDMKEEQGEGKIIQETIKWKHIEWSFECAQNDFKGHGGTQSNFPHYHFQMRINGQQFINYNDFHIPFSKDDELKLQLMQDEESDFIHTFAGAGAGMQDAMKLDINKIFDSADFRGDELSGVFHFQSIIQAPNGIDGEIIDEAYEESRKTGKSVAKIMRDKLKNDDTVSIISIGSPADSVPDIAKRTEHKKRQNTKGK
jgi:hypothetical protein